MSSIIPQLVESDLMIRELRGNKPRRFRKPRKQKHPDGLIRTYRAELLAILERTKRLVDSHLVPRLGELQRLAATRRDEDREDVDNFSTILGTIFRVIREGAEPELEIETAAATTARGVSRFNVREVRSQMRGVLGIDVFFNEPRLQASLDDFAAANVRLIKSVPEQFLDQTEDLVRRGFRSGRRAEEIADEIVTRFGVTQSRADLIARDQIGKLNANLTRDRHQALGIEEYIWRTSRDERVRATHRRLEGSRHSWDDPPSVGRGRTAHPGEDFRCRCTAEPIIPGAPPPPRTTPADVPTARARRRAAARPKPKAPKAPPSRTVKLRSGKVVTLTDEQVERRATAAELQNDTARAKASSLKRTAAMLWNWVHGSKRKVSVALKSGAIKEFGLRGIAYNPRGFEIAPADVARAAADARRLWRKTQREFKRRGIKTVKVFRGIKGPVAERGAVESWSTDRKVAEGFAGPHGSVLAEDVPIENILTMTGGPEWVDGIHGDQDEVVVLF